MNSESLYSFIGPSVCSNPHHDTRKIAILLVPLLSDVGAGIVSGQYPLEEGPLSQMSDAVASLDKEPHTPAQQVNTKYFYPTDQIFSLVSVSAGPRHPRAARHAQHARHTGTQESAAGQVGPQHQGYSALISNISSCFAVREPTKTSPTISKLISIWKI